MRLPPALFFLLLGAGCQGTPSGALPPLSQRLWPERAPGETTGMGMGRVQDRHPKLGAPVTRLAEVGVPSFEFHRVAGAGRRACVLICPGGGYNILAWDLEGTEVAAWLNGLGIHAAVLKYRVPRRKGRPKHEAPLQDAQRALRLLRSRAADFGVDPARLGVLGFSAGGHLAAAASCNFAAPGYPPVDRHDQASARPDFSVLIYPAYLHQKGQQNLAPELPVGPRTPPSIVVMTGDDRLGTEGPIAWYLALERQQIPAELHLYPRGGHGYGMRLKGRGVSTWPDRVAGFLQRLGVYE